MSKMIAALNIGTVEPPNTVYDDPTTIFGVGQVVQNGLIAFYSIMGITLLGFLLYGGVKWLIAAGDSDNIEAAQKTINNAIVGIIILVGSLFIVDIGTGILGLSSPFNIVIPTLLP